MDVLPKSSPVRCWEGERPHEPKLRKNNRKSGLAGTLALPGNGVWATRPDVGCKVPRLPGILLANSYRIRGVRLSRTLATPYPSPIHHLSDSYPTPIQQEADA